MKINSIFRQNRAVWIVEVIALLLFCFFMGAIIFTNIGRIQEENGVYTFEQNWNYEETEDGGIWLKNVIPENLPEGMYLMFRSQLQTVEVSVDDIQIYKYPDRKFFHNVVPSTWNMVRIPQSAVGKEIQIRLNSSYSRFSNKTGEIYYGYYENLMLYIRCRQTLWLILSLMIGVIGMIIVITSLAFRKYQVFLQQEFLGIVLIFVSFWMCGESKMPVDYVRQDIQHYITMISLNFIPVFIMALCYLRNNHRRKIIDWIFAGVTFMCSLYFIIVQLHIIEFVDTFYLIHFFIFLSVICMLGVIIDKKKQGKAKYINSEIFCVGLLIVAVCMEILLFYMGKSRTIGIYIRIAVLVYAIHMMIVGYKKMFSSVLEKIDLEKKLQLSQVQLMTSQIQPHFIYNTLHSIQALIRCEPEEAYRMVQYFSTYLRAELSLMNEQTVIPFSQELKHIQAYVEIEKIRFGKRLQVNYEILESDFSVPPLSVQPLVENAIKHGVCRKIQGGTVWVRAGKNDIGYQIEIRDDGVGFDVDQLPEEGSDSYGIRNIRFRIEQICRGKLIIESYPGEGSRVVIEIPG